MKQVDATKIVGSVAVAVLGMSIFGCSHALTGAKQDVQANEQKVNATADKVGNAVKKIPEDVNATAITPEVKTAIIRDPVLNDPRNHINIETHGTVIHITGHVQNDSMKQRAADDAQVVLNKRHPNYKVSNDLTISNGMAS